MSPPGTGKGRAGVRAWGRDARLSLARLPAIGHTLGLARIPDAPQVAVRDPWPGTADRGSRLMRGELDLGFATARLVPGAWNELATAEVPLREAAHGFVWLRDLRALGTDGARVRARTLVADWMARAASHGPARRPAVIARRIAAWLGHYDFFAASAEDDFRAALMRRLVTDARVLAALLPLPTAELDTLTALKGLIAAGVALPENTNLLARALRFLPAELDRQILRDGGHVERGPGAQFRALRELVEMKLLLASGGVSPPVALAACLDRMCPALRTLRHGDGGLALFNGTAEEDPLQVDLVLGQAGRGRATHPSLAETGFERLASNRTVLIADTGVPAPPGLDRAAAAGTLAFELSVGRERLIVNCGATPIPEAWRQALRSTAAHSTLTLADTSSSELRADGTIGRRPAKVVVQRQTANGAHWLEASHDGWQKTHGITHHRRLYLAETGDDLRGEDALAGGETGAFAIRFHLHPAVDPALEQDADAALLRLPSGGLWRLRADGATISLEGSLYAGTGARLASRQVVLTATVETSPQTRWALTRIA